MLLTLLISTVLKFLNLYCIVKGKLIHIIVNKYSKIVNTQDINFSQVNKNFHITIAPTFVTVISLNTYWKF